MSEKSKKSTSQKKTPAKKPTTKSAAKKTTTKTTPKKTTSTKKPTTTTKKSTAKKPTSTTKKPAAKKPSTTTKKSTSTKKSTTTTKKPAVKTTTKKPTTPKPRTRKLKIVKAQILGYRRNKRLQVTNQAIAKILDDYNHKALIGKKFVLEFPNSDALARGVVVATHGKDSSKQVRIRFDNAGMTAYAINQIADIHI